MKKKTLLLTGTSGFVGYNFLKYALSNKYQVIDILRKKNKNLKKLKDLKKRYNQNYKTIFFSNYQDLKKNIDKVKIDYFINFATFYRNKNNLCVTLLKINYNQSTSLHCHPQKKSGFILLNGKALFQLGLWKKRSEVHTSPSKLMIARGLFHSIKSLSKEGLLALEFETPVNKKDLVRFKDNYGRSNKAYEGKKFTQSINSNYIKFKTPTSKIKQIYKFGNVKLILEVLRVKVLVHLL